MAGWVDPIRRLLGWLQSGETVFEPGGIRIRFAEPTRSLRFPEPVRVFRFTEIAMQLIAVEKTEAEILPYEFDLTDWTMLDGRPITAAPVTVSPSGPTLGAPAISGQIVQVKISGGTNGSVYKVTCKPETADGYRGEVAFHLVIVNK